MRPVLVAVATAGTAMILAGCSLPTTAPAPPDPSIESTSSVPAPTIRPTATSPTPIPTPTPSAGDLPFATRPGSFKRVHVVGQLFPVRRSGGTATVDLYIASRDPDAVFIVADKLGDGSTETASKSLNSVDGIRLLDTTAKKAYLPAVTADNACVCSPDDDNMDYNNSVWVTVTFAAPPETVTTVSVSVPSFGTFADVPII